MIVAIHTCRTKYFREMYFPCFDKTFRIGNDIFDPIFEDQCRMNERNSADNNCITSCDIPNKRVICVLSIDTISKLFSETITDLLPICYPYPKEINRELFLHPVVNKCSKLKFRLSNFSGNIKNIKIDILRHIVVLV